MKRKKAVEARLAADALCGPEAHSRRSPARDREPSSREDARRPRRGGIGQGARRPRRGRDLGGRHPGRHRVRAHPDEVRDAATRSTRRCARLEEGTYGDCFECGDEISEPRLRALPFAVRCKDCEEARETAEQRERRCRSGAARRRCFHSNYVSDLRRPDVPGSAGGWEPAFRRSIPASVQVSNGRTRTRHRSDRKEDRA